MYGLQPYFRPFHPFHVNFYVLLILPAEKPLKRTKSSAWN